MQAPQLQEVLHNSGDRCTLWHVVLTPDSIHFCLTSTTWFLVYARLLVSCQKGDWTAAATCALADCAALPLPLAIPPVAQVRQTQRVHIVGSAKAVLTLAEAPESRFFEHVVQLDMTDLPKTGWKQAACNDAIAAAVDAWPGLEKVCLQEGTSDPKKAESSKYLDVDYPDW
jgi:hypothetical protein